MLLFIMLFIKLIHTSVSWKHPTNCYFTVFYSNGSRSYCLDERCGQHLDIQSLENRKCRTNFLSLKFSSYDIFKNLLVKSSSKIPLASFFASGRPSIERLLQIEFLSPFTNSEPFQLEQLRLLTGSFMSNIDTYELIFNGKIANYNTKLFIDRDMFMSDEQQAIDTLRLRFICNQNEIVEWELIKSIQSLPSSPCPQQIDFLQIGNYVNYRHASHLIIFISVITCLCITIILMLIMICLLSYTYDNNGRSSKQQSISNSDMDLLKGIERF